MLASGAFDGLHAGHINYLTEAKDLCRRKGANVYLRVAIAPDSYIRTSKQREPYWPQLQRARTVDAVRGVDGTICHSQDSIADLIYTHRPDWVVKGSDWEGNIPLDVLHACKAVGAETIYLRTGLKSTTAARSAVPATTRRDDRFMLDGFASLVQSQRSATSAWLPVTDYSFAYRSAIEGKHPDLIAETFHPTKVLDYGCGPGVLLKLLRDRGVDAVGYDIVPGWVAQLEPSQRAELAPRGFDLVICREVLEHCTVREIRQVVTRLCDLSDRYVYVTTRFHQNPAHLLDVATSDALDPTHISLCHPDFLRMLFVLEGFVWRPDLEAQVDWKGYKRCLVYERR